MSGLSDSDPAKKLRRQYHAKRVRAILAQNKGNERECFVLTAESEALREQLDMIDNEQPAIPVQRNCVRWVDEDAEF